MPQPATFRVVHVFVALADNEHQGIVPVAAKLGNGEDAEHNLYWGSAYGVKTFFSRSADWMRVMCGSRLKSEILERCIFKHRAQSAYLVADAYRGKEIRQAILDFLTSAAGDGAETITLPSSAAGATISARGGSNLVVYVGHDGLMDFQLSRLPPNQNKVRREAIVLACASKQYFSPLLQASGVYPILLTTGLMAPEAYTLKSALDGWMAAEDAEQIRERAATAYDKYQKCGMKAARRLFTTGW